MQHRHAVRIRAGGDWRHDLEKDRSGPASPAFRTPFVPLVPILAIITCGYLMVIQGKMTWIRFFVWLAVGLVLYFCYEKPAEAVWARPSLRRSPPAKNP